MCSLCFGMKKSRTVTTKHRQKQHGDWKAEDLLSGLLSLFKQWPKESVKGTAKESPIPRQTLSDHWVPIRAVLKDRKLSGLPYDEWFFSSLLIGKKIIGRPTQEDILRHDLLRAAAAFMPVPARCLKARAKSVVMRRQHPDELVDWKSSKGWKR